MTSQTETSASNVDLNLFKAIGALCAAAALAGLLVACGGEEPGDADQQLPDVPGNPGKGDQGLANAEPIPADNLVYACIRSTACGVKPYPRVSNCVAYYTEMLVALGKAPLYDTIYGCANGAETCGALRQCFGVTETCNSSYQARCTPDGKAVFCDLLDKTTFTYDCKAAGMGCALDSQYGFAAKCVPAAGAGASPAKGQMKTTVDCSDKRCVKTGNSCSEDDLNRCSGDDLQACLGGEWITFDCAKLKLGACQSQAGGWASCGAAS